MQLIPRFLRREVEWRRADPNLPLVITLSGNHHVPQDLVEGLARKCNLELVDLRPQTEGEKTQSIMARDSSRMLRLLRPTDKRGYLLVGRSAHLFGTKEIQERLTLDKPPQIVAKVYLESHSMAERKRLASEKGLTSEKEITQIGSEIFNKDAAVAEEYHSIYGISPDEQKAMRDIIKIRAYDGGGNDSKWRPSGDLLKEIKEKLDKALG